MKIIAIGGASGSSRDKKITIEGLVKHTVPGERFTVFNSMSPYCITDVSNSTYGVCDDEPLLIIGKSLGAVRTWWFAYNHWDEIKHFKKIRIVLIDPHGWQRGDGRWGSYGRRMLNGKWRNLESNHEWFDHPDFEIVNVFQREEFPRGAMVEVIWKGARRHLITKNIQMPPGANHWNCTDIKTPTGQFVAGIIRDVAEELG